MYLTSIAAAALALVAVTSHAAEGADRACGAGTCAKKVKSAPASDAGCSRKDAACGKKDTASAPEAGCSKKDAAAPEASCSKKEAGCSKKDAACSKK